MRELKLLIRIICGFGWGGFLSWLGFPYTTFQYWIGILLLIAIIVTE